MNVKKFSKKGAKQMSSLEIKSKIIAAGLHCYQVAAEIGITDSSFSRKLRTGLNDADTDKVLKAIEKLKTT